MIALPVSDESHAKTMGLPRRNPFISLSGVFFDTERICFTLTDCSLGIIMKITHKL
jgi:hypothetical protein